MSARALRLGTRGSQLALWQAHAVADVLAGHGTVCEIVIIKTSGDRLQEAPLSEVGGKRLFVKEIEDALMRGDIDVAVHSAKDMPAILPGGLDLGATLPREDPRDALVLPADVPSGDLASVQPTLGDAPVLGTSSVRRTAQLAAVFPNAVFRPIRGNVDTRLRKLAESGYDALVLASAGLRRLGLGDRITTALPVETCCPAPGQGIIAVEIRKDDRATREALRPIDDAAASVSLAAERSLVATLGGGCQLPLGAVALHRGSELEMHAVVAAPDGQRVIGARARASSTDPVALGERVAAALVDEGAMEILDAVRGSQGPVEGSY